MVIPPVPPWPSLAGLCVVVGGVTVTVSQAQAAVAVLSSSKSSAISALLRAAGNPLASCDWRAVAGPYLPAARAALAPTHRRGCGGRHVAAEAFCRGVAAACDAAVAAFITGAAASLSSDHRVAAEIAADAVACRRRKWAATARAQLAAASRRAAAACTATGCTRASACGTGSCPFASPQFAGAGVPAGPGSLRRPPGHSPGGSYGLSPALAAYLSQVPYVPAVTIRDSDFSSAASQAA